jgi:hypothetical protein
MVLSSALTNDILALLLAHYFRPLVCAPKYIISCCQIRSLKLRSRRHSCYIYDFQQFSFVFIHAY